MIDLYFDKTKFRSELNKWKKKLTKLDDELLILIRELINEILDGR